MEPPSSEFLVIPIMVDCMVCIGYCLLVPGGIADARCYIALLRGHKTETKETTRRRPFFIFRKTPAGARVEVELRYGNRSSRGITTTRVKALRLVFANGIFQIPAAARFCASINLLTRFDSHVSILWSLFASDRPFVEASRPASFL
jgi:hypothetical protein